MTTTIQISNEVKTFLDRMKIFERETYNEIMDEYRKFIALREVLQVVRKRELKEVEPLCTICFNDTISYAFVPCGHTFCQTCVKKQSLSCSICRSSVRERLKLFLS